MSDQTLIFHVDINSCYASCEKILDPSLRNKPVVVLSNNDGCIIALDTTAKKLGFKLGDPWFQVEAAATAKGIIARSSNYELYGDISERVMLVLREYAQDFEQYSIDEAFLTITTSPSQAHRIATSIKDALGRRVGVPVCVGVASSKTLAKLANKTAKKVDALKGVCVWPLIPETTRAQLLETLPVSEIWGVGKQTTKKLAGMGITSISHLQGANTSLIRKRFSIVLMRTVLELNGVRAIELETERKVKDQLIFSRSFSTPIETEKEMHQVLSIYAQKAAHRLHKDRQVCAHLSAFCSTSYFSEHMQSHPAIRMKLPAPTADPAVLTKAALALLPRADFSYGRYARAGVLLTDLSPAGWNSALEPFEFAHEKRNITDAMESINERFGESKIGLGYAGFAQQPSWQMKRELLSPRGTTHWSELAIVKQ